MNPLKRRRTWGSLTHGTVLGYKNSSGETFLAVVLGNPQLARVPNDYPKQPITIPLLWPKWDGVGTSFCVSTSLSAELNPKWWWVIVEGMDE